MTGLCSLWKRRYPIGLPYCTLITFTHFFCSWIQDLVPSLSYPESCCSKPQSAELGSYGVCCLFVNPHTDFHSGWTHPYPQQSIHCFLFLGSHEHWHLIFVFSVTNSGWDGILDALLVCMSLRSAKVEHLFIYLLVISIPLSEILMVGLLEFSFRFLNS